MQSEKWENMPSAEHSHGEPRTDSCDHPSALISAATLAKRLDVSVRTVWRLLSSGKLPDPVKVGGSVRWRNGDIATWIREGCPERRATSRRAAITTTTGRAVGCR